MVLDATGLSMTRASPAESQESDFRSTDNVEAFETDVIVPL